MPSRTDGAADAHPELREDILVPCDAADAILAQAPDAEKPFFRVQSDRTVSVLDIDYERRSELDHCGSADRARNKENFRARACRRILPAHRGSKIPT